jgi:hypothetical protein
MGKETPMSDTVIRDLHELDSDLASALYNNGVDLPSPISAILATIEGENYGADCWHWLVRLESGQHAYIAGGCDYTGWDYQSNCDAFVEPTLEAALRQVPESYRDELRAKLEQASTPMSDSDTVMFYLCAGCEHVCKFGIDIPMSDTDGIEVKTVGSVYCANCMPAESKAHGVPLRQVIEMRQARGQAIIPESILFGSP